MYFTIIGFFISLALAIPTFGLSILVFYIVKYLIDQKSKQRIIKAVLESYENHNTSIIINYVNNKAIRNFFNEYKTTEDSYKRTVILKGMYSGYVNINNRGETIAVILKNGSSIIITCFDAPIYTGNDIISLITKAEAHEKIINSFLENYN